MAVCLWNGGEMKKGQIRTGVVRNVKFPNRAMVVLEPLEGAADGEEICEVKGALPGQKISVVITKVRKGKGEGRLKEILEKSNICQQQKKLIFYLLKFLNVDSTHHFFAVRNRWFFKCLTVTQFLNYTCFFKFPFEFFQSLLDVFAFFYWNYNHNYLEISLFVSFE